MVQVPSISEAFDMMNSTSDHAFYWADLGITSITQGSCDFKPVLSMTKRGPLTMYFQKDWKYGKLMNFL